MRTNDSRARVRTRSGLLVDRRELLWSAAALLGAPRVAFGAAGGGIAPDKHLIVVFAEGGWDVTYCFDPKLECTDPSGNPCPIQGPEVDQTSDPDDIEYIRTFGNIPIICNDLKRPSVTSFFDKWYTRAHVINGVFTGSIAHEPCRVRLFTGTTDGTRADLATISGYLKGSALPLGTVDLSGWSMSGPLASSSGRLGSQSQISALIDENTQFNAPSFLGAEYPLYTMDPSDLGRVEDYIYARLDAMCTRFEDGGQNSLAMKDLAASLDRGTRFRSQAASILQSLQIGKEASYGEQLVMAVDLINAGMCHSVVVDTRQEFDTHAFNVAQHGALDATFSGLSLLMDALEASQMLDKVVVAVISEMTRTPLRNLAEGKDHWGHTSAMLLGAVSGNRVSGHSSYLLESMPVDFATGEPQPEGSDAPLNKYDNLCAGILDLVDVDPEEWLPGVVPFTAARPA